MSGREELAARLPGLAEALLAWIRRHAGERLLRFESAEDLAQGAQLAALEAAEGFEYRGQAELAGWLLTIARHHLARRVAHWQAAKRGCGRLARLVGESGGADPADTRTSPPSFAVRRELVVVVARVLAALPERDRKLLEGWARGEALEEQAREQGAGYEATKRARQRALERLTKAVRLVTGD